MKKLHLRRHGISRTARTAKAGLVLAAAAASILFNRNASAITATWTGTDLGDDWSDSGNWNSAVPGSTSSTTNTDTAVFNSTPASNAVTLDTSNWNIQNITFTLSTADNFNIGSTTGNSLLLTDGGLIWEDSSVAGAASETISAPIELEGTTYTVQNDSGTSTSGLKLNAISGGSAGATTLTLQGASTSSSNQIIGPIANGSSSSLGLLKTGAGTWQLASTTASTYTGPTIVNQGELNVGTALGISAATDVTVNGGNGTSNFEYSVNAGPFPTVHSLTMNPGSQFTEANSSCWLNIANNSGPALILNGQSSTLNDSSDPKFKGAVILAGAVAGTGGIVFTNGTTTSFSISDEKFLDLGTVNRPLYVTKGAYSTDLQINGTISDTGGIIKTGAGTVKLENTAEFAETFTGPIEIQEGSLKQTGNGTSNQFSGVNTLLIDGGNFNLQGNSAAGDATFAAVTMTSGSISGTSFNRIFAPSFTFNVAAGNTFSVGGSFGDESGGAILAGDGTPSGISAVLMNGPGQATLSGTFNTYSGGTTINSGTMLANMNFSATAGNGQALGTGNPLGTGAVAINGANLRFDPNVASGSGIATSYIVANLASGTLFTYGGGNTINVQQGNETSVSVTVGGTGAVLNRVNNGTLVIAAGLGTANLGNTEQFIINGTAPTVTNGIVNTAIVGQNDDSNASGDFLTYGANGFALATYTSTNINTTSSTDVCNAGAGTSTIALSGSVSHYALNAEAQTIDVAGHVLTVGDNLSGHQAGLILNGGSIIDSGGGTGALAFNQDEGTIYTSKAGGTISAGITGTGGVTAFGPGKLYLTGNNSFTGGLNVNQGTVNVATDSNLGASGGSITFGGGTLQFASSFPTAVTRSIIINAGGGTIDPQSGTLTVSSNVTGAGPLTKVGVGNLILNGSGNTYAGTTTISAGNLQIGNGGAGGSLGSGNVINNAGLIFDSSSAISVPSVISGSGNLTQGGTGGTVALSASNTYAGTTTINSGTVQAGNANALGFGGAITAASVASFPVATVNSGGTLDLNAQTLNKPVTLNGGTLTNSNTSATAGLSTGVNGYVVNSGGSGISADLTTVSGGGGAGASATLLLGLTNSSLTVTGGSGYTVAPTVAISGGGGTGATATASISGSAVTVTINNAGVGYTSAPTITLSGGDGTGASVTANADNFTAVGALAVLPGSGYTSAPTATIPYINNPSAVTSVTPTITSILDTLSVQASSTISGAGAFALNTAVNGAATSGTVTLTLAGTSTANSIGGVISDGTAGGTLALAKSNTSTWTLTGANTYSGGTTVNAGTLDVSNATGSATGSGNVILNGGVLASDSGSISGNVSAAASSVIAPGGVGTIGTLSLGGLTTAAGATLNFDLGTGTGTITNGDLLNLGSGTIIIASSTNITLGTDPGVSAIGNDYELIGGTISGISTSSFSLPAAPAGVAYSLSKIGGFIDLVVAAGVVGPANLTWNDATSNNTWDTAASSNWNNGTSTTVFNALDNVTFNDTNGSAAGRYAVTLTSTVSPGSVTVNNSSNNYTISGAGGKIVDAGAFSKSGSDTLTVGTALNVVGTTSITAGTLKLATGVSGGSGPAITSHINLASLSITGNGQFDVNNNHIIITYGATDPFSTIANYIKSGYNGGGWNGPGIISSAALTKTNGLSYGLGYADGKDGKVSGLVSGQIEVAYTLLGDANLDGLVNAADFTILAANFNQPVTGWDLGDFNYDGLVNAADFTDLAANFNQSVSGAAVSAGDVAALDAFAAANGLSLPTSSVPEPTSMGLLTLGAVGMLARRRRRST
jgi:autotransporter-associated beta strand protein